MKFAERCVDDDDDNLIVFPPGADDNSYILIYSVHIHLKTRPECGTSLNMMPAPCYIKFTNVLTPGPITHGDTPAAPIRGGPQTVRLLVVRDGEFDRLPFILRSLANFLRDV